MSTQEVENFTAPLGYTSSSEMVVCIEARKLGRYYFLGSTYFHTQSYEDDALAKDTKRSKISKDVTEAEHNVYELKND